MKKEVSKATSTAAMPISTAAMPTSTTAKPLVMGLMISPEEYLYRSVGMMQG